MKHGLGKLRRRLHGLKVSGGTTWDDLCGIAQPCVLEGSSESHDGRIHM